MDVLLLAWPNRADIHLEMNHLNLQRYVLLILSLLVIGRPCNSLLRVTPEFNSVIHPFTNQFVIGSLQFHSTKLLLVVSGLTVMLFA